jgi:hypothetical protein
MKTNSIKLLLAVGISAFCLLPSAFGQGALTPPGAPAPTMKTLAQIEPRTPISSAAYFTISSPGSYYFTTNLTVPSTDFGILIESGNVTVDLNGFTLQGAPGSYDGIDISGTYTNITVRNGTITGCGQNGISADAGYSCNLVFEHLTISANGSDGIVTQAGSVVRDCCSISNGFFGIYCNGGLISGCMSRNNGNYGIYANDCTVRDCQVEGNNSTGIAADYSVVRDCLVRSNAVYGIYAAGSTVSGCCVSGNTDAGILVNGDDCQIIGNNCCGNNISGNVNYAGILIYYNNSRVEDNYVIGNRNAGIWVFNNGYTNNIVVKNTVIGNGANNYNIPTGQIYGPLITNTVSGVITNSNPWANFSF